MKSTCALTAFLVVASASSCSAFAPMSRQALALPLQKTVPSTLLNLSDKPKEEVATEAVLAAEEDEEDVFEKVEMLGKGAAKVRIDKLNVAPIQMTWQ
jgi:hypothetical protein